MTTETITCLVKLKERIPVAEDTLALQFEKPANFIFRSGQCIDLTLRSPSVTDGEANVRTEGFSGY